MTSAPKPDPHAAILAAFLLAAAGTLAFGLICVFFSRPPLPF